MAATDLLSLNEACHTLGLGTLDAAVTTPKGTVLAMAVSAVSDALADKCGTIIYGTVTGELHNGGGNIIYTTRSPLQSVVTLVEYDNTTAATLTAETNTTKTATNYLADLDNGRIIRRDSNLDATFPVGRQNIYVTYVAGRFASTATVGSRFKEAAALTLKNAWRAYEASVQQVGEFDTPIESFPRFTIPNAVKELLANEWRVGSGIGE